jgi:uncharacterized protein (DUF1330 family)
MPRMAAYMISELEVLDPVAIQEYRALATPTVAKFGGRYLVRGGATETIEGGWAPKGIVVIEFPSMAQARAWYHSPEYTATLPIRQRAVARRVIFVEGVPPA